MEEKDEKKEEKEKKFSKILKEIGETSIALAGLNYEISKRYAKRNIRNAVDKVNRSIDSATMGRVRNSSKIYDQLQLRKEKILKNYEESLTKLEESKLKEVEKLELEKVNLESRKERCLKLKDRNTADENAYIEKIDSDLSNKLKEIDQKYESKAKKLHEIVEKEDFSSETRKLVTECGNLKKEKEDAIANSKSKKDEKLKKFQEKREMYEKKFDELNNKISEIEKLKEEVERNIKESEDKALIGKNTELRMLAKPSMFNRLSHLIIRTFGSSEKKSQVLYDEIIKPIKDNIDNFKDEKVLKIINEQKAKIDKTLGEIINVKDQFTKNVKEKEKVVKTKVGEKKNKLKNAFSEKIKKAKDFGQSIYDGVKEEKNNVVNKAVSVRESARKDLQDVRDDINKKYGQKQSENRDLIEQEKIYGIDQRKKDDDGEVR